MANVRGVALEKLKEAQAAADSLPVASTVPTNEAQNEANKKTLAALWAVFEFVDAAELAGV